MEIEDFLSPADIIIDARASDKDALLRDLCSHAAARLNLDGDQVVEEVLKRQELGSSGTGSGIAIPHARIPDVERPFGVLARLRKAMAFDAIDGEPGEHRPVAVAARIRGRQADQCSRICSPQAAELGDGP